MNEQIKYASKCFRVAEAFHGNEKAFLAWIYGIEKRITTVFGSINIGTIDYIAKRRDEGLREV